MKQAWITSGNGEYAGGRAEAGFAVVHRDNQLQIVAHWDSTKGSGKPGELTWKVPGDSIAIVHTHGNKLERVPTAPKDLALRFPNYVYKPDSLYVAMPTTPGKPAQIVHISGQKH